MSYIPVSAWNEGFRGNISSLGAPTQNDSSRTRLRRYNGPVPSQAQNKSRFEHAHPRHHVYALETTGVLIIAATLLAITLARYWYAIHGSLR
jgi:hypothetical protein